MHIARGHKVYGMKLSISWIFDHLQADWRNYDIRQLIEQFNRTTAEIEGYKKVEFYADSITFAFVDASDPIKGTIISINGEELQSLAYRSDLVIGDCVIVKRNELGVYQWATTAMFGGTKERILAAVAPDEDAVASIEPVDYIIDIDNKSINHRPDLWSHRGIAREMGALINVPLIALDQLCAAREIIRVKEREYTAVSGIKTAIEAGGGCSHFASLYCPSLFYKPSTLSLMARLARVDIAARNFFVDLTNYVMLDIGNPMHAFDSDMLSAKELVVKRGRAKEPLMLLDGESIELTNNDLVVTSGNKPVSLAGVMGGAAHAISRTTRSMILEAAHFDGATIRQMSTRHKKRTESSMRFEKGLDPSMISDALCRYIQLAGDALPINDQPIVLLGAPLQPVIICVEHQFIEKRLGCSIPSARVKELLQQVGFCVQQQMQNETIVYDITVPSFRSGKDVSIKEDIVEEVGRLMGYSHIIAQPIAMQQRSFSLTRTQKVRTIKTIMACGLRMQELYNYALFDESFLNTISWVPDCTLSVLHPVSDNWKRLVTSLVPHLLKAVGENSVARKQLRFFEMARVWRCSDTEINEKKSVAGIVFDADESYDFYAGKSDLHVLFHALGLQPTWQQVQDPSWPWFMPYQTAHVMLDGVYCGTAGMIPDELMRRITVKGKAFVFEFDAELLVGLGKKIHTFVPPTKYPVVHRDISLFASLTVAAATIQQLIAGVDERITQVQLIDFFEKKEWHDVRSLTFRIVMSDAEKTLLTAEIDTITDAVVTLLSKYNITVRT